METIKVNMSPNPLDVQTIHASQNDSEAREWEFELHNNGDVIDASEISDQLVFKAYKGGTEQILPENGSVPTTSPIIADIKYPHGEMTDQEFLYRESPTEEDGLAKITDIKGNTLVWNQLVQNGNFADTSNWRTEYSATISASNNVLSLTPTAQNGRVSQNFTYKANHKLLIMADVKLSSTSGTFDYVTLSAYAIDNRAHVSTQRPIASTDWQKLYVFCYSTSSNANNRFMFTDGRANDWGTTQIRNFMAFDLTSMFGETKANELFASEQSQVGKGLLEFTSLFSKPYYDYCQGAMLSFGGRNVKFNQLFTENYSVTFETGNTSAKAVRRVTGITKGHKCLLTWVQNKTLASNTRNTPNITYSNGTNQQVYQDAASNRNLSSGKYGWVFNAPTDNINNWIDIYFWVHSPNVEVTMSSFNIIDLTEMFGAGNEPSAEGFLELFPNDFYEYTTGKYMNIGQPVSLKTTGKNLIFKVIEVCNIDSTGKLVTDGQGYYDMAVAYVVKGQQYTFQPRHGNEIMGYFLTEPSIGSQTYDKSRITNGTTTFMAQITGYVAIRLNRPETNAQLEIGTSATNYADYIEPSALSIPLDEFPNGMDGINDARDYKSETGYVKRIGQITFDGSENWSVHGNIASWFYIDGYMADAKFVSDTTPLKNRNTGGYEAVGYTSAGGLLNMQFTFNPTSGTGGGSRTIFKNTSYTTVDQWKTYLQNHPITISYELSTPLENYGVVDLGTLDWIYNDSFKRFHSTGLSSLAKFPPNDTTVANILSNEFSTVSAVYFNNNKTVDKLVALSMYGSIYARNLSMTDVNEFKSSLSGVYLLYEKQNPQGFTTASLVTENAEIPLSNEDGVLIGKCTEQLSENPGFIDAKIKLSDADGECYSNKLQLHVERSPQ